jgi:hypothetical protein
MGRKGVSKRKTKTNPVSGGSGKGTPSSVMKVFEKLPTTATETTKATPAAKSSVRHDSDRPQKGRNG